MPTEMSKLTISITAFKLAGRKHLAVTRLGGINVKGRPADEEDLAVRNLLYRLSGSDGDENAELALDMAIAGTTVDDEVKQLQAPSDEPPPDPAATE